MKNKVKIFCCFLMICVMILSLSSCLILNILNYNGYRGEHKALYTVAVNNIFGINGYLSNGEVASDPDIYIIETDDFGRTLFFYTEYYEYISDPEIDYGMAFVIMQSSKDGYAYYYQDKCYIPYFDVTSDWESISAQLDANYFDSFKDENDWNQELNEEKCAKVKISSKKSEGKLRPADYEFDEIIYPYEVENGYTGEDNTICRFSIYCETDSYGRELHYVYGSTMNTAENGEEIYERYVYAIILNADGTGSENGIVKISTPTDSVAAISELKENTNWNISN